MDTHLLQRGITLYRWRRATGTRSDSMKLWREGKASVQSTRMRKKASSKLRALRLQSYEREIPDFAAQVLPSTNFILVSVRQKRGTGADTSGDAPLVKEPRRKCLEGLPDHRSVPGEEFLYHINQIVCLFMRFHVKKKIVSPLSLPEQLLEDTNPESASPSHNAHMHSSTDPTQPDIARNIAVCLFPRLRCRNRIWNRHRSPREYTPRSSGSKSPRRRRWAEKEMSDGTHGIGTSRPRP